MTADEFIAAWELAFPRYVNAGIASSGPGKPNKLLVMQLGQKIADLFATAGGGDGTLAYATVADMNADLDHDENTQAAVYADPGGDTTNHNGIWTKVGESGSGSWTWLRSLSIVELGVRLDALEAINAENRLTALEDTTDANAPFILAYRREMIERPGDAPELFADAYTGTPDASTKTALPPATVATGKVLQLSGAHIIARRGWVRIEPNRKYLVRAIAQRATDPADPLGDAVELGMAWFTNAGAAVSGTPTSVLGTFSALTVASGRTQKQAIVATASGDDITNVAPAGTVYARPYVRSYGADGLTNVEVLEVKDVTDAIGDAIASSLVDDAIAAAATVQTVETEVQGLRDDAVNAAASAGADLWSRPVDSIEASVPGSPSIGDRVLLDETNVTHPNQVAEYFADGWHYSGAPLSGQLLAVGKSAYIFTGTKFKNMLAKRVLASKFDTIHDAHTFAASVGFPLVVDEDCSLSSDLTTTVPVHFREGGGIVTLGSYNLIHSAPVYGPKYQTWYNQSGSGVVTAPDGAVLTPQNFGGVADGSTNCKSYIQKAVDACERATTGATVLIPTGSYKISSGFINLLHRTKRTHFRGEGRQRSIITSYDANSPILVTTGQFRDYGDMTLRYDSQRADTAIGCACILIVNADPIIGGGENATGAYWTRARAFELKYGAFLMHAPQPLSTTLAASASSGDTSISVTAISDSTSPCLVTGVPTTITLNSGTMAAQITGVSGSGPYTLTLDRALTGAASSGNAVASSQPLVFSNTIGDIFGTNFSWAGICIRGNGTGNSWPNIYLSGSGATDVYQTAKYSVLLQSQLEMSFGQINTEWVNPTVNNVQITAGYTGTINSWHAEGVKLGNGAALLATNQSLTVGSLSLRALGQAGTDVVYLVAPTADGCDVIVHNFRCRGSYIDNPANVYAVKGTSTFPNASVRFKEVRLDYGIYDSGLDAKTAPQLVSPSSAAWILKEFGDIIPDGAIGYARNVRCDSGGGADQIFYFNTKRALIETVVYTRANISLSSYQGGIYTATGGGGSAILGSTSTHSGLTAPEKIEKPSISNVSDIYDFASLADGRWWLRKGANQAATSVTTTARQRYNDGTNGFGQLEITTASAHGLKRGDLVTSSGLGGATANNGTFRVISVPSSTKFRVYSYIGRTDPTNAVEALTSDTGGTVSILPTVDVFAYGKAIAA